MKYLSFHAVNGLLLILVLVTILLWVVWTPGSAGPELDRERPEVNLKATELADPPTKTATTRNPDLESSVQ